MTVTRIHEDPRVTKPYTDAQWERLAETVRRAIAAEDIVSLDDVFPPHVLP